VSHLVNIGMMEYIRKSARLALQPDHRNREKSLSSFLFLLLLLLTAGIRPASAGAAAEEGSVVSLGAVSGLPNSNVLVPVLWAPSPPELKIGNFSASIRFENKSVSFVKGEKGFLLDGVNANFKVETKSDPADPDHTLLQLDVATQGEPRKGLREGLVLTLVFHIAEKAAAESKVPLEFARISAGDLSSPPKAIQPLQGQAGEIEIIPPEQVPYVPCFFFTH
jgi:hypothetical protein